MRLKNYSPVKMMAADREDLSVVSSFVQDAVLKIGDMAYLPKEERFALVANRFVWEEGISKTFGPFIRVRCGLHFDDVKSVKSRNIRQDAKSAVISILALTYTTDDKGDHHIALELSGGGEILLAVSAVNATLTDLSEPWKTKSKPDHGLD